MFTAAKNATHVQDLGSGCDVCCSCGNVVSRRTSRGSTVGPDRPAGLEPVCHSCSRTGTSHSTELLIYGKQASFIFCGLYLGPFLWTQVIKIFHGCFTRLNQLITQSTSQQQWTKTTNRPLRLYFQLVLRHLFLFCVLAINATKVVGLMALSTGHCDELQVKISKY